MQLRGHLGSDVAVLRTGLHGLRRSSHVHQDHRDSASRTKGQQFRVERSPADVVDQIRPGPKGRLGNRSLAGVHR